MATFRDFLSAADAPATALPEANPCPPGHELRDGACVRATPLGGLFGGPAPSSGLPARSRRADFARWLAALIRGDAPTNVVRPLVPQYGGDIVSRPSSCPPGTDLVCYEDGSCACR